MSWSYSVMEIVDVVMRVPPLFVLDSILNQTFLSSMTTDHAFSYFIWLCLTLICFLCAIVFFLLPLKVLLEVYSIGLSTMVLWFSYYFNSRYIAEETTISTSEEDNQMDAAQLIPQRLVVNVAVQIAMALSYNSFRLDLPSSVSGNVRTFMQRFQTATYICMLLPITCNIVGFPAPYLHRVTSIYALIIALELKLTLLMRCKSAILWVKLTYLTAKTFIRTRGFQPGIQIFLEVQWVRLHVPTVLRVFWITRLASQITAIVVDRWWMTQMDTSQDVLEVSSSLEIAQELLVSGCETIVALMGMTSVISSVTNYIGVMMASFVGSDTDEDKNMGTISAILFFILALQTGLTGLDPEKRYVRLGRNFCLLSAAILHFCHGIVSTILMNLSASQNPSPWKHSRPLIMCAFLIVFPTCFLHYLWSNHSISTWLLAVSAFNIEVIVKVIISLLLYIVFMVDAYAEVFWETLDDYVYYIKSTGNSIEFLFGIFVFCNGAWIMVFESGGVIRACMMCVHAYFNIFVQAKNGWKVFIKRRTAVNKIKSLPQASSAQLETHNDVCAICYQDLQSARVTNCNHFFHSVCLRKWLYVQDNCPLCHELIYIPEPDPNIENRNNAEFEQNMNDANMENMANAMNYRAGLRREGGAPRPNQPPVAQNNGLAAHAHQD